MWKQIGLKDGISNSTVTSFQTRHLTPSLGARSPVPHWPPGLQQSTLAWLGKALHAPYNLSTSKPDPSLAFSFPPIIYSSPFLTQPRKPAHNPSDGLCFHFFLHLLVGYASVSIKIHLPLLRPPGLFSSFKSLLKLISGNNWLNSANSSSSLALGKNMDTQVRKNWVLDLR